MVSELFGSEKEHGDKAEEEKKDEKKRQFLNTISEDDIKRHHYDAHDEMRKAKRYFMMKLMCREKAFEKRRGYDEEPLEKTLESIISPEKIAAMKFSVILLYYFLDWRFAAILATN